MDTPKFFLEKRKDKLSGALITTNVPIIMDFSFNGQRLQYFTGLRIDASKWDDGIERTLKGETTRTRLHQGKAKRNTANSSEINIRLAQLSAKLITIFEAAKALKVPITTDYLRKELKKEGDSAKFDNVFKVLEKFLEFKKLNSSHNYHKNLSCSLQLFKDFVGRKTIHFPDLDAQLLTDYTAHLINERGNSHNTVINHQTSIKVFLKWADKNHYEVRKDALQYEIERTKVPEVQHIYWDELMTLYHLKLKSPTLRETRDFLCFGCFTGQRFGDIRNLKPEYIAENIWTNFVTKSHKAKPLYIPLNDFAKEILSRYKDLKTGYCLPRMTNKELNEQCKLLGKEAGLTRLVTKVKYYKGEAIKTTQPFYEIMTSHIMRKTFVTNALHLGMTTTMIKEFTGHATEKEFNKYLAILKKDKVNAMQIFSEAQQTYKTKPAKKKPKAKNG